MPCRDTPSLVLGAATNQARAFHLFAAVSLFGKGLGQTVTGPVGDTGPRGPGPVKSTAGNQSPTVRIPNVNGTFKCARSNCSSSNVCKSDRPRVASAAAESGHASVTDRAADCGRRLGQCEWGLGPRLSLPSPGSILSSGHGRVSPIRASKSLRASSATLQTKADVEDGIDDRSLLQSLVTS